MTLTPCAYRVGNTTRFIGVVEVYDEHDQVVHLFTTAEFTNEDAATRAAIMRAKIELEPNGPGERGSRMTTREIIDYAQALTPADSMLELATAHTKLRRCSDLVTRPDLMPDWIKAWQHVENTKNQQNANAAAGEIVRIT